MNKVSGLFDAFCYICSLENNKPKVVPSAYSLRFIPVTRAHSPDFSRGDFKAGRGN